MKIAMFTDSYWPRVNGVTVSVESFSTELIRAGHEVVVVCSEYPDSRQIERLTVLPRRFGSDCRSGTVPPALIRVPSNPVLISREDRSARLEKWVWLKKQVDEFGPDIVHVHSEFVIGNFGILYARQRKKPLVYTSHTLWEDYVGDYVPFIPKCLMKKAIQKYVKQLAKKVHAIITPTKKIEEVIRSYGIKKHIYLLPTGIDEKMFSLCPSDTARFSAEFFSHFPKLAEKKILLYVGRVGQEKNIRFLLDVLAEVRKTADDAVLCIVGSGPYFETLKEETALLGLEDVTEFTGYIDRKDIPYIYNLASVFVFASKTETQGLVTIEAMLSGLPVVAIGEMGTVDVMQGDNGGFMVKDDCAEFSSRVVQLLTDPVLYRQKAEEGKTYGKKWTIGEMTKKLVVIYQNTDNFYRKHVLTRKWYHFEFD